MEIPTGFNRTWKAPVVAIIALSLLPLLNAKKPQDVEPQWLTAEQAFDTSHNGNAPDPDASKKVVLDASYEEAFHAATMAVTQAQWEIDKQDKAAGVLLAHRVTEESLDRVYLSHSHTTEFADEALYTQPKRHIYFYRVRLNEVSAKQTEIALEVKVQGDCTEHCLTSMILPSTKPFCKEYTERRGELRMGTSLSAKDRQDVSQFVIMVRNNLIAAGVQ
jgi:hypothetical protein